MHTHRHILLVFAAILAGMPLAAQQDTVLLAPASIIDHEPARALGLHTVELDSQWLAQPSGQPLSALLEYHTPISLKAYGYGGLTTLSLRGSGASHTPLLWNGFPLRSPMNGTFDLNLVPLILVEKVAIQYGGSSPFAGSGAVGGVVHLQSLPRNWQPEITFSNTLGSFAFQEQAMQVLAGSERFASKTSLYLSSAENDFPYESLTHPTPRIEQQKHAAYSRQGLLQEFQWQVNEHLAWETSYWWQHMDRQLPALPTQLLATSEQEDITHRLTTRLRLHKGKGEWSLRGAFFRESINYDDGSTGIRSLSSANTAIAAADGEQRVHPRHQLHYSLQTWWLQGQSTGYEDIYQQHRLVGYGAWHSQWLKRRLHIQLALRQELVDAAFTPFLPSLGARFWLLPKVEFFAQASRNFRLPTFNDLYWKTGDSEGNPDLLPEKGWSYEGGFRLEGGERLRWEAAATGYSSTLANLITWIPDKGKWWPVNLSEVWMRGVELSGNARWKRGLHHLLLAAGGSFTRSTRIDVPEEEQVQLTFIPPLKGNISASYTYRNTTLLYRQQYTGVRFTSTDHHQWLPGFSTAEVGLSQRWQRKGGSFQLQLSVLNVFNTPYQLMPQRPMPGRHYRIRLVADLQTLSSTFKH